MEYRFSPVSGETDVKLDSFQTKQEEKDQDVAIQENIDEQSKIPLEFDSAVLNDNFLDNLLPKNSQTDLESVLTKEEEDVAVHKDKNPLKTAGTVLDKNILVTCETDFKQESLQTTNQRHDVTVQVTINEQGKIPLNIDNTVLDENFLVEILSRNSSAELKSEITNYSETVTDIDFILDDSKETPSCGIVLESEIEITAEVSHETENSATEKLPLESDRNTYREDDSIWSDDESSSSSDSSSSSLSDTEFRKVMVESSIPKKFPVVKTKGELGLDDLPPIEDLAISVNEQEMVIIGKIHAVVEKLVVIQAYKDTKPLDFDSVLFLSYDKPLGRIFDVFGPVVKPMYCVRFNSTEDIDSKGVEIGADVFFAPEKSEITSYVFVDELRKQKGSDASWKFNNEPPEELLDYSDDEEEKAAKRKRNLKNRNRQFSINSDVAPKRPALSGASSPQSIYEDDVQHVSPRNNAQHYSFRFPKSNSFGDTPIHPPSPSPSLCSVMSTANRVPDSFSCSSPRLSHPQIQFSPHHRLQRPSFNPPTSQSYSMDSLHPSSHSPSLRSVMSTAIRVPNSFSSSPQLSQSQMQFSQQHIVQRPPSPFLFSPYRPPPPVFGQVALLSALPSQLPSSSPLSSPFMNSVATLIPVTHSPVTPQNYFSQRFPRNPSPVSQTHFAPGNSGMYLGHRFPCSPPPVSPGQRVLPDPWLPNRPPSPFVPNYSQVPPNHPLAVQIPNQSNPPVSMHAYQPSGIHLQLQPYNANFNSNNFQPRYY